MICLNIDVINKVEAMLFSTVNYNGPAMYIFYSSVNGYYYIGSSGNLTKRLKDHKYKYLNKESVEKYLNKNISNIFSSGLENIYVTYIKTDNRDAAYEKEQEYLDLYGNGDNCCNISKRAKPSFDYVPFDDPDYRRSISERLKGNKYSVGHITTEETRKKLSTSISASFITKPRVGVIIERWRKSMESVWNGGDYGKLQQTKQVNPVVIDGVVYPNAAEAGRLLNLPREKVRRRVANPKFPNYKHFVK